MWILRTQNIYIRTISKSGSLPSVVVKDSVKAVSDEEKAVSDEEKAELFNEYFYSVLTDSTMLLQILEEVSIPSNTISEVSFSLEDIFNELSCWPGQNWTKNPK